MALKKIGVLWKKKDKMDRDFLSGTLDLGVLGTVQLLIFQNNKIFDDQPDCTIHLVGAERRILKTGGDNVLPLPQRR
jgi:hypothetical protein